MGQYYRAVIGDKTGQDYSAYRTTGKLMECMGWNNKYTCSVAKILLNAPPALHG